jgi:hypothetical protein
MFKGLGRLAGYGEIDFLHPNSDIQI